MPTAQKYASTSEEKTYYIEAQFHPMEGRPYWTPLSEYQGDSKFPGYFESQYTPISFKSPEEALEHVRKTFKEEGRSFFLGPKDHTDDGEDSRIWTTDGTRLWSSFRITTDNI